MRTLSENFKAVMDEIIRPQMKLYFEVDTDVFDTVHSQGDGETLEFDTTVAPVVIPTDTLNEHYYAVLDDNMPIDDPNRICAPASAETMPDGVSVPYGITECIEMADEAVIGSTTNYYENFQPFFAPAILSFKGGHIPTTIVVERYNASTSTWSVEQTIDNSDRNEEILYSPLGGISHAADFRRFKVSQTSGGRTDGRFQFNWIRLKTGAIQTPPTEPIVFEYDYISNVNISQATDLTSQTLPSYEMTVECLDVDEVYTPDSSFWENQFVIGKKCFLKIGYEIGDGIEYIPFFNGKLSAVPSYSMGKITFNVSVDMKDVPDGWDIAFVSLAEADLGGNLARWKYIDYIEEHGLFNSYDVFHGEDDEDTSDCDYYGTVADGGEVRQLIANALGCFITAGFNTIDLFNTNDIQYNPPIDYLTRYEQIQCTLDNQPKAGKICITTNENRLSDEYVDITAQVAVIEVPAQESVDVDFVIPFYAIAKIEAHNYPTNEFSYDGLVGESLNTDGTTTATLRFTNTTGSTQYLTSVKAKFYKVANQKFEETEIIDASNTATDIYTNDNYLITDYYAADKANRVAKFMSDISEQYEVDLIQNFEYEIGDIVRLETREGVFKTCVITGLNFVFPGTSGHATLRRIFAIEDTPEAVLHEANVFISYGESSVLVNADEVNAEHDDAFVLGLMDDYTTATEHIFVLGGTDNVYSDASEVSITDNNNHVWKVIALSGGTGEPDLPYIQLPPYRAPFVVENALAYGAITLIRKIYEEQGMNAPVDYECAYEIETH